MGKKSITVIGLLFIFALSRGQSKFLLNQNDRVVFYGDSITDFGQYPTYVETFVLTRYPTLKVRFYNSGVGGDTVSGGWMGKVEERLPRDLFAYNPTIFTVMLGMNDAGYVPYSDANYNAYTKGLDYIVKEARTKIPNAQGWLLRPTPFDEITRPIPFPDGYNSILIKFGDYMESLAGKNAYRTVDLNRPLNDLLARAKSLNEPLSQSLISDRIHPSDGAHYVTSWTLLKAWGATGTVSTTTLDVQSGRISGVNVKFKGVSTKGGKVGWNSLEGSLPFPFDRSNDVNNLALQATGLDREVNQEILRVLNLPAGNYALNIDQTEVGRYTQEDFRKGVNLGNVYTPMYAQAIKVLDATWERSNLQKEWWRNIQFKYAWLQTSGPKQAVTGFQALESDFVDHQRKLAQPTWHKFELVKH